MFCKIIFDTFRATGKTSYMGSASDSCFNCTAAKFSSGGSSCVECPAGVELSLTHVTCLGMQVFGKNQREEQIHFFLKIQQHNF